MPGSYTMNLYRGDTYHWKFVVWQDTAMTIPADLTGVTAKSQIRDKPSGAFIVDLVVNVVLPNTITADLAQVDSQRLLPPACAWDLQLTYPNGDVITILAGAVNVTPDITDSTPGGLTKRAADAKGKYEAWREKQAAAAAAAE